MCDQHILIMWKTAVKHSILLFEKKCGNNFLSQRKESHCTRQKICTIGALILAGLPEELFVFLFLYLNPKQDRPSTIHETHVICLLCILTF